jgi:fatty-acyl-CoA synthase
MTGIHQQPMSTRAMNLAHWVTQNCRRLPNHTALVWKERAWNWSEFDASVSALARALTGMGVEPGQAVLVHSGNSNEMLESMFACFRLGAVWVPTNFRLLPDDVAYMAEVSQARVFLCQAGYPGHAQAVVRAQPDTKVVWMAGDQQVHEGDTVSQLTERHLGVDVPNAPVDMNTPCWLFFTSGTTGRPKAAVLTHGQMGFVITNHLCDLMPGTTEADGSLVLAPLSHGAGVHQLCMFARGAKTVLMPSDRFDAPEAFRLVEHHGLTNIFTVPTILKMLVEDSSVGSYNHSSLRYVIYAGAPMYRRDQKTAIEALGAVLVQYYGLAEVTGNITVLPPTMHTLEEDDPHPGSCGIERTGMLVSVQDEQGTELRAGKTGEICVIGPAVFSGYLNNPEANAKAFRNGWFRTGDMGHIDAEGFVYLTGRSSEMYISGGSNIYPREIEEKILKHPAISEVSVLGIPDPKWGEVGFAVCVTTPAASIDEAAVLQWLSTQIARYKLPKHILFWEALPKSGYGKVPKHLVRDELARRKSIAGSVK